MNIFEKIDAKINTLSKHIIDFVFNKKNPRMHVNRHQELHEFFQKHNFKTGLEIGTSAGYSAVAFSLFYPESTLDSIDIVNRPLNVKFFEEMEVDSRINLILGNSSNIPKNKIYDYILIDGNHDYEAAKFDWNNIQSHIKKGTCVMIDDLQHPHQPASVKKLWQEIERNYKKGKIYKLTQDIGVVEIY